METMEELFSESRAYTIRVYPRVRHLWFRILDCLLCSRTTRPTDRLYPEIQQHIRPADGVLDHAPLCNQGGRARGTRRAGSRGALIYLCSPRNSAAREMPFCNEVATSLASLSFSSATVALFFATSISILTVAGWLVFQKAESFKQSVDRKLKRWRKE
ncbi:hypothetical protein ACFX2I_024454 [Malus domestica]